jgi:hypothetical protein
MKLGYDFWEMWENAKGKGRKRKVKRRKIKAKIVY